MAQPTTEDVEAALWRRLSPEEKKRKTQEASAASASRLQELMSLRCAEEARAVKQAICELYAPTWSETSSEDRRRGCVVCLEALDETGQKLRMMPCSHIFHQRCIFKWLLVNGVCPICQFALPSQEEAERLLDDEQEEEEARQPVRKKKRTDDDDEPMMSTHPIHNEPTALAWFFLRLGKCADSASWKQC
ncbi:hypothetical protein BS78_05G041100 [Paspalum vaginatum]|nr:hypothetical protein BS78_05G041100 [Paspalum vaginatum]